MRAKLVYSSPVTVCDWLDEPIKDTRVLAALDGISCLEGSVLEYLTTEISDQDEFNGGFLRLTFAENRLRLCIEIDSPRKLTKPELAELREDIDGQVSDGIGESAFDFLAEEADISIDTFSITGSWKSKIVQLTGDAWTPKKISTERADNDRCCKQLVSVIKTIEEEEEKKEQAKGGDKPNPKKLFKFIDESDKEGVITEIAKLGGDLSFIGNGKLPFMNFHNRALLKLLLDAGLKPNLFDRDGHTLLWLAAASETCTRLLLKNGAEIDLRNTEVYEQTALMRAAWLGEDKVVRLLLEEGANPRLKSRFGETALQIAQEQGYGKNMPEVKRLLKKATEKKKK